MSTSTSSLPSNLQHLFTAYFAKPNSNPTFLSVLHLLRRDAAQCFGYNPNTYNVAKSNMRIDATILWPGAMTVFAGIDLLSKLNAGTDSDKKPKKMKIDDPDAWRYSVSERFTKFLQLDITPSCETDAQLIYRLRCALDHSFALWASARKKNDSDCSFTLDQQNNRILLSKRTALTGETEAIVYLYELHRRFEIAINRFQEIYHHRLCSSAIERENFQDLLDKYGFIGIAHASEFGW